MNDLTPAMLLRMMADAFKEFGVHTNNGETATSAAWRVETWLRNATRPIPADAGCDHSWVWGAEEKPSGPEAWRCTKCGALDPKPRSAARLSTAPPAEGGEPTDDQVNDLIALVVRAPAGVKRWLTNFARAAREIGPSAETRSAKADGAGDDGRSPVNPDQDVARQDEHPGSNAGRAEGAPVTNLAGRSSPAAPRLPLRCAGGVVLHSIGKGMCCPGCGARMGEACTRVEHERNAELAAAPLSSGVSRCEHDFRTYGKTTECIKCGASRTETRPCSHVFTSIDGGPVHCIMCHKEFAGGATELKPPQFTVEVSEMRESHQTTYWVVLTREGCDSVFASPAEVRITPFKSTHREYAECEASEWAAFLGTTITRRAPSTPEQEKSDGTS